MAKAETFKTARETVLQERMRRDPQWFVFTSGLVTKDEHDPASPLKPFPDEPYLRVLLDVCCVAGKIYPPSEAVYALGASERAWVEAVAQTGIVLVEKSRQVMATWLVCAYALWRAKARPQSRSRARKMAMVGFARAPGKEPKAVTRIVIAICPPASSVRLF